MFFFVISIFKNYGHFRRYSNVMMSRLRFVHMTAMTVVTLSFLVTSVYACSTSVSCFVGVTDMTQAEKELWASLEHLALRKKNELRVLDYMQGCMICRISSH